MENTGITKKEKVLLIYILIGYSYFINVKQDIFPWLKFTSH